MKAPTAAAVSVIVLATAGPAAAPEPGAPTAHWAKTGTKQAERLVNRYHRWKRQQRLLYCGTPTCNRRLGMLMATRRWDRNEAACLDGLWGGRESGWDQYADNPNSSAYGIPQALPGSKMGPGWQSNVLVQIRWGLGYIAGRYGTPCGALGHSHAAGWY